MCFSPLGFKGNLPLVELQLYSLLGFKGNLSLLDIYVFFFFSLLGDACTNGGPRSVLRGMGPSRSASSDHRRGPSLPGPWDFGTGESTRSHRLGDRQIVSGGFGLKANRCSVVQWHPFSFFLGGCPTKIVFPKKGSLFAPGSLNN